MPDDLPRFEPRPLPYPVTPDHVPPGGKRAARLKDDEERERRLAISEYQWAEIARMLLEGSTQETIANRLSIPQAQVSLRVSQMRMQWAGEGEVASKELKATELARLGNIEEKAWMTVMKLEDKGDDFTDLDHKRHKAAYERIQWVITTRIKILGLNAPEEVIAWQVQARSAGIDAEALYESLVQQMAESMQGDVIDLEPTDYAVSEPPDPDETEGEESDQ